MIETTEKVKIQKAENKLMNSILSNYLTDGNSIGLWRLPNSSRKYLIICNEGIKEVEDVVLEEIGSGFIFSPFDSKKNKIFLEANISFTFDQGEVTSDLGVEQIEAQIKLDKESTRKAPRYYHSKNNRYKQIDKTQFLELIEKSIREIEMGRFEKIVPSRAKEISLPIDFDAVEVFNTLCALYPHAFISLVSAPNMGTWIGASPELLVSVDANLKFRTAAVAGTQTIAAETDLKLVSWTQKEIEEQAMVSRYIIGCFKKIRLREFDEHGPKSWRAGNLVHLKTEYEVDMAATNFLQLGTVMLKLLHPTSAVCGMPREESFSFLQENEKLDRNFYSGFLGPVNFQNETHLFVNLRCMEWNNQVATLFAGAGVTLDSNPEKEWEETELKMDTLLKVIKP